MQVLIEENLFTREKLPIHMKEKEKITIEEVIKHCEKYITEKDFRSYDLFDALTNNFINRLTKDRKLLRRIIIQIVRRSPFELHWLGMKKMLHTKTITDLITFYSVRGGDTKKEINYFFDQLMQRRSGKGYGWGLNFPYTSRFVDADEGTPNLYNTANAGIAICQAYPHLNEKNKQIAKESINGIVSFIESELGYVDEGNKGWYSYYPFQKYPVYNVNALTVYFMSLAKKIDNLNADFLDGRINAILKMLSDEQQDDGSWFYSRSPDGKWVDGFHTGFVVESLAFAYKEKQDEDLKQMLEKGWEFYTTKMFTPEGYPRYYQKSNQYPIESQNCAQAIQTLANIALWLHLKEDELLDKCIKVCNNNLYNKKGYFYQSKTRWFTNKRVYIRWSVTPMMVALSYVMQYKEQKK